MSDIPSEIFYEILRRVPVDDLFRFRSVCKTWRRIIDDPSFAKHHFRRGIGQDWFFHLGKIDKSKLLLIPLTELIHHRGKRIYPKTLLGPDVLCMRNFPVPSCNGFILLSNSNNIFVWRIWNPFTSESLELDLRNQFANIQFQNSYNPYSGIGHDEVNDDYKVVRIDELFRTYIYSVNSKEWRQIGDFPDCRIGHANGVYAYGALHWVAYSKEDEDEGWIVAIELSTGNYRNIALPSLISERNIYCCLELTEMNGCLFLSFSSCLSGHFLFWIIKDYGRKDTWDDLGIFKFRYDKRATLLAYLKSREQVMFYQRYEDKYWWYDMGSKSVRKIGMKFGEDDIEYNYDTFSSQVFPASLIRLGKSDMSDESVQSQGTSGSKRKRCLAIERLPSEDA